MKYQVLIVAILAAIGQTTADCGCLKCSKDLQVVSPPYYPYQVIVKGSPCEKPLPYQPPPPSYIPIHPNPTYQLSSIINSGCQPIYAYKYKLQTPVAPVQPSAPTLTGLVARPDRLVLQRPNCGVYTGDDGCCRNIATRPGIAGCTSIFSDGFYGSPAPLQQVQIVGRPKIGPILEPVTADGISCSCRYGHSRRKRDLPPILRKSVRFFVGLLPLFLRFPIEEVLKYHRMGGGKRSFVPSHGGRVAKPSGTMLGRLVKPSETFLEKLQRVNGRGKRSVVLGGDGLRLPFLKVTDVENQLDDSEEEEEEEEEDSSEEDVKRKVLVYSPREEYLAPLNFNQLVPHNPIYYLLNAPIRFLHHFHKLGRQISPVLKSVPHVFVNSRKYLRSFGKHLKNDVLNFASDLIGDFDEMESHNYRYVRPRRLKRSLEQYQPEYSLVFGNQTEDKVRRKRYILKVVDEDEVEQFLREKLGGLVDQPEKPKKRKEKDKDKDTNRKRLVVEQLSPKVIIDNKGRPFVEINGVKRPLFHHRKMEANQKIEKEHDQEETTEDVKEKINSIISEARERIGQNPPVHHNVPNQMIKERINQILIEIQNLINLDFDKYSTIHTDLCKLQSFKDLLVNEWKKILVDDKSNDIPSKINLLDDFKEMQILRDKSVQDIASVLSTQSNFMAKKLIKMLVRLQKLQCIIYRVVEDFGERIKMGTDFDVRKEIKYVDYLASLHFVVGLTKQDLENDLKRERDAALQNEMTVLESLRKLAETTHDPQKMYEEAQILWEFKNVDKLQKDTIVEMNEKISRGQKVRKELKILFDLMRQAENCEEKQRKVLEEIFHGEHHTERIEVERSGEIEEAGQVVASSRSTRSRSRPKRRRIVPESTVVSRMRSFPHKMIIEDKKPVRLVSNGYTMTAYKVSDGFD